MNATNHPRFTHLQQKYLDDLVNQLYYRALVNGGLTV